MNNRQRKFAEYYAAYGNAAQAAREAGYSAKTARQQGERLLTNVDILQYVRELQDKAAVSRISSVMQIKAFWSDVVKNEDEKMSDRLKASELLAKSAGMFVNIHPDKDDFVLITKEDRDDVIIYLPPIDNEDECYLPSVDSEEEK